MFPFWKKTGQKELTDKLSPRSSPTKSPKQSPCSAVSNGDISLTSEEGFGPYISGPLAGFNDDELADGDGESVDHQGPRTHSRLSKSLAEVLADKGALGYFIQFLQACEVVSLVKFWLDSESFRLATQSTSTTRPVACCSRITFEQLEQCYDNDGECKYFTGAKSLSDIPVYSSPVRYGHTLSKKIEVHRNQAEQTQTLSEFSSSNNSSVIKSTVENCVSNCTVSASNKMNLDHKLAGGVYSSSLPPDVEPYNLVSPPKLSATSQDDHTQNGCCIVDSRTYVFKCQSCNGICYSVNDAVRIYRKYIAPNASFLVPLSEEVRNRVVANICREDGQLDADTFTEAQEEVYTLMEKEYFNDFLCSEFHCKHQIDVLTNGEVLLADILYNDTALFYFMEFMEQEGQHGLLEFWLAAVNFQQQLSEKGNAYDPIEAQNDAMILYDKYFSLQATCPLGFSAKVRVAVEHNICRVGGPLPNCFQWPVDIVTRVLDKTCLHPFLTSQLYFRYLSELINTIQANPPLISHNRKTGSECSSEVSISTQNTLLAMEDPVPTRKHLRNLHDKDMRIDSRQLYDPDSLWRRRHQSGLSFGRINEIGRFEPDFEPEPDKKGESRITRVMKKLVHMEEDKAKEELAWQIAEKIVKDITNMTLGDQDPFQS